jgi:hercynine metabolism protein
MSAGTGPGPGKTSGTNSGTGTGPAGWFEQLEAQLERQLETFLAANPAQEALLQEQELQEKQQRLKRRRLELQGQADQARTSLLALVSEINQWQQRVQRARDAGAGDLAARAEHHLGQLMGQGRDRWQALSELGRSFQAVEAELEQLARQAPSPTYAPAGGARAGGPQQAAQAKEQAEPEPLDQAWAAFEAQQALEDLRRRQG